MELLPHSQFEKLRLRQFEPNARDRETTWIEFLDSRWLGESFEGIEFLRREDDACRLGCIGIGFEDISPELPLSILSAVRLPLRHHLGLQSVTSILGGFTGTLEGEHGFVAHDFICGTLDRYFIRCWFYKDAGLHGLDLVRADLLPNNHAAS